MCFKGGYIDAWGRGIVKIMMACKEAQLPEPEIQEFQNGILITLFKNIFSKETLYALGLNDRQMNAVLFVKERGKITNKEYQSMYGVARRTATRDLKELVDKGILKSSEIKGAGSNYVL